MDFCAFRTGLAIRMHFLICPLAPEFLPAIAAAGLAVILPSALVDWRSTEVGCVANETASLVFGDW